MYKKLIQTVLILFLILSFGTLGYVIIEKWQFFDALYMTVITLATVGYGETHPLSFTGRIFTIFLILSGMSILLYTVSSITSFIVEGELSQFFRRKKMLNAISQLKNHFIVCGAGKVGSHIISELAKTKREFVIIEKDKNVITSFENYLCINNDATDENILKQAGIENADGLFAALSTDEENIFLIITAKQIKPTLKIIAKAVQDTAAKKLITAGANSVIQPNLIGGLRMVSEMVRPTVVSFLDMMLKEGKGDLRVEEIEIKKPVLKTVSDIFLQIQKRNALLLAVYSKDGYKFNPPQNTAIQSTDKLIIMGTPEQITALRENL
ncbi:MAG: potassium channel protein [Elusimicrobiota bacterium]